MPSSDADPWLERWLPLVADRVGADPILELGCASGRDTARLVEAGHRVVGIDLSAAAIETARSRLPHQTFHCQDIRTPWPGPPAVGVIVASLSLHYFEWLETLALAVRIRRRLRPRGLLLCRLNSTGDVHYGATGHPELAENYHLVDGAPKRFFDRPSVLRLFDEGWRLLSLEEQSVDRYEQPKVIWEAILERED
ncbi:MAG: class I SAM-dependent methyltransferase [Caldimonas sp.]